MNLFNLTSFFVFSGLAILIGGILLFYRRSTREVHQRMEALEENEKNYRRLVKTIPVIIFKGFADGSAEFFDDRFEAITGYPVEEFNSRRMKWQDIIVPEDVTRVKDVFKLGLKDHQILCAGVSPQGQIRGGSLVSGTGPHRLQ